MSPVYESSSICHSSDGQIPEYVCIDYPGNVVNINNMLDTLGGTQMISKVHSESNRRLELRFRPLDVYCKPACGERCSSTSLLVKIRRRRKVSKKSASSSSSTCNDESREEIHTTLMGVVSTTYVFNTLCDAQYLPLLTAEDAIPLTSTSGSTTCTTSATETTSISENTSVTPTTESVHVTATNTSSTTVTDDHGTRPSTSNIAPDLDSDSSSYLPYNCFAPQHLEMPSWLHEQPQCLFLPPAAFSRMDTPQFFFFRGDGSESFIKKEQSKTHSSRAVTAVTIATDTKHGSSDSTRVSSAADSTALSTVTATVCVAAGSSGDSAVTALPGATASTSDGTSSYTPNIICHTRQRRTLFAIFRNYAEATPMQPDPQALQQLQLKFLQRSIVPVYDKLKVLFEERPIWSRNALKVMLGYGSDSLKYLLPTVGYYFSTGPWRNLWVKFGYDPREKPNSFIYQTFDYRLRQTGLLKNLIEAKRSYTNYILPYKSSSASKRKISVIQSELLGNDKQGSGPTCDSSRLESSASLSEREPIVAGVEAGATSMPIMDNIKKTLTKMKRDEDDDGDYVEMDEEDASSEGFKDEVYIFRPGSIPPYRQMFYQYCDLLVPEIQQVLEEAVLSTSSSLRCDERFGWLSRHVEEECRRIVTKLIADAVHKRNKLDKE